MTGHKEWDRKFETENRELFNKLQDIHEKERLWAIAKLEEKCSGYGIPTKFIDSLVNIIEKDKSSIVRAMAIRALYHQSNETWPYGPEDREKVFEVIIENVRGLGVGGIDRHIAYELLEIENRIHWLRK